MNGEQRHQQSQARITSSTARLDLFWQEMDTFTSNWGCCLTAKPGYCLQNSLLADLVPNPMWFSSRLNPVGKGHAPFSSQPSPVSFLSSSKISNAAERVTYRELKYCFRQCMLWLTTYTGPPAEKLLGKLQGEKLWETFFSLTNEVSTLTGELCAIFISAASSYLLSCTRHRGRQTADNAGNGNRMWSQTTAELVARVPPGSLWSPSGVCLTGTRARKVISPPQTAASGGETRNHSKLKLFRKIGKPASPLHCKAPRVSKTYKRSLLCGMRVLC